MNTEYEMCSCKHFGGMSGLKQQHKNRVELGHGHLWKTYGEIEPRGSRLCKKCASIRNKQRRERMNNKDMKTHK